jgi:archaemetzincin
MLMDLVGIIPTGKVWGLILRDLILDSKTLFEKAGKKLMIDIVTERPCPLPRLAYDKDLRKYRVEGFYLQAFDIKSEVERLHHISINKVLVLTDVDICDPPYMNGFGFSDAANRMFAIVSIFKLERGASETVLRDRLVKEAAHELGHTYGLDHCAKSSCPMSDSPSILEIDQKAKEFCSRCTGMLSDSGYGRYWGV